jgi:hypothetical protein
MTPQALWTLVITSVGFFILTLDKLVVSAVVPVIPERLERQPERGLVDGQRLHVTFAVLLLTWRRLPGMFAPLAPRCSAAGPQ